MASALLILLKYMKDFSSFVVENSQTLLHSVLEFSVYRSSCIIQIDPEKISQIETIVEILLHKGLSVDGVDCSGNTALHFAVQEKKFFIIPKLVDRITDVNVRNSLGETALHVMLKLSGVNEYELKNLVKLLISKGADINSIDNDGWSPVHLAAKKKYRSILQSFQKLGADLKVSTASCENIWHILASTSNVNVEKDRFRLFENSDLSQLNRNANEDALIKFLTDENLDINALSLAGSTPLHVALKSCNVPVVEALVQQGVDVNFREKSSQMMPIHIAAQKGCVDAIDILIKAGADVNAEAFGVTALHLTAQHCRSTIMKNLIRSGADVDVVDDENYSPLHYVVCNKNFKAFVYLSEIGVQECCDVPLEIFSNKFSVLSAYEDALMYIDKYRSIDMPFINVLRVFEKGTIDENWEEPSAIIANEVIKMKALQIGPDTSLYQFLRMSLKQRMLFVMQESVSRFIRWPDLKTEFSMYYDMIMYKYREAFMNRSLLIGAKHSLSEMINIDLPDLCVDKIFHYLTNQNLKILDKASNISMPKCFHRDEISSDCKTNLYKSLISNDANSNISPRELILLEIFCKAKKNIKLR